METLYTVASIAFLVFITAEVVSGIILYRNRAKFAPRIRQSVRQLLGIDTIEARLTSHDRFADETLSRIERKINYIGRHTKFERDQLRAMGVLQTDTSSNLAGQDKNSNGTVVPLRRS